MALHDGSLDARPDYRWIEAQINERKDRAFKRVIDRNPEPKEYDANATSSIAKYGPIANWDVSAITDMSELNFKDQILLMKERKILC